MLLLFRKRKAASDTFDRDNGALTGWNYTNNAWTILNNAAICTPPLGAELFSNGDFASDTVWTKGTGWTIVAGVATKAAGTAAAVKQNTIGILQKWLRVSYDLTRTAGTLSTLIGNKSGAGHNTNGNKISVNRGSTFAEAGANGDSSFVGTVDNMTAKLITTSDLFASKANMPLNATIAANLTLHYDTPAGVVGWMDSYTAPQNLVVLYINGASWFLEKFVGGSYAFVNGGTIAAVAGAQIKMAGARSGANLLVTPYYNGSALAAASTISDANIVSNRRHGLFSTSELNSFDSVSIR